MKKILLIISSVLLLSACELTVGERQLFIKNVSLKTESYLTNSLPTSNGFYVQIQKDFRSSDSSSLGILSKSQYIISKIDFDGNINWQRISDSRISMNFVKDNKGNLYGIDQTIPNKLQRFDSFLQKNAETTLFFDKFTDKGIYVGPLEHWKDDKFLTYGGVIVKGGSEYIYQQFFSIISIKNGVEKFILDSEEMPFGRYKYQINEAGEIFGFVIQTDNEKGQTKILTRKYDTNFKQVEAKSKTLPFLLNTNVLTQNKKGLYQINQNYVNNKSSIIFIDPNLEVKELPLDFAYSSQSFIETSDKSLMVIDDRKVYAVSEDFRLLLIDKFETPTYNPFIKVDNKTTIFSVINGNRPNEIIFSTKIVNEPVSNKLLYFE